MSRLDTYRADPVRFAREVLGWEAWSKQAEILASVRDHPRTSVASSHGVGKTSTAAVAALWYLSVFPDSRVVSTAPTQRQLRDVLWREIASLYHASRGFIGGELFGTRLELSPTWFAVGLTTESPEQFQGHHAEHLLLIADEASGIEEPIYEAAMGSLTSPESRLLLISNATRPSGSFFDSFHSARDFYNGIRISAFDTPAFTGEKVSRKVARRLVSKTWVEAMTRKWGEGSPLWQVRINAQFPTASDDLVIGLGDVEDAQRRDVEPGLPLVVSCDVARFGADSTVIAVRQGNRVRIEKSYSGRDLMRTVGEILTTARKLERDTGGKPLLVVDDAGVGGGVVDRLKEQREYPVEAFNGATASRSQEYARRRDASWFRFSELLPNLDLPADEDLAADLLAPRYSIDSAGRRVVEPKSETKRRLRRSPDRGDAVTMAFAVDCTTTPIRVARFQARARHGAFPRRPGGSAWLGGGAPSVAEMNERLGVRVTPDSLPVYSATDIEEAEARVLGRRRR